MLSLLFITPYTLGNKYCNILISATVLIHKENQNTMQTALCFTFYLSGQLLPEGWVYFQSSLYHVSSTKKTWQESRDDCLSRGADLMIIDRLYREMWIGLTDSAQEGTWRWVDGTLVNTSFWLPGEPNNSDQGKEENCAEIHIAGGWNDKLCGFQHHGICEKKVAPSIEG
uniref:C-type lectin domain-containing protein n=1 Tax=Salarias fasciatus TaxID=181472 RepID=A0A672HW95_SALFA